MYEAPYSFMTPAYARCYADRYSAMDPRHVFTVHAVLRSWPFAKAVELGSLHGASSTAFIEAVNMGRLADALFCDVDLTPSLVSVMKNTTRPEAVRYTSSHSWDVLAGDEFFDFILLDANHNKSSVDKELEHIVRRKPLCLMAHDTNATDAGYPKCEGAKMIRSVFQAMPEYFCLEDAANRPGERTHRGLFLATTDPDLFKVATQAYETFCPSIEVLI